MGDRWELPQPDKGASTKTHSSCQTQLLSEAHLITQQERPKGDSSRVWIGISPEKMHRHAAHWKALSIVSHQSNASPHFMRCDFYLLGWLKQRRRACGDIRASYVASGIAKQCNQFEKSLEVSQNVKYILKQQFHSEVSTQEEWKYVHIDMCAWMCTAALFIVAKVEQPKSWMD